MGLDVEVIGNAPGAPPPAEVERLVGLALASAGGGAPGALPMTSTSSPTRGS